VAGHAGCDTLFDAGCVGGVRDGKSRKQKGGESRDKPIHVVVGGHAFPKTGCKSDMLIEHCKGSAGCMKRASLSNRQL
jgi:hypothetical protein